MSAPQMPVEYPTSDPIPAVTEATAWEVAYQRFETPEQERRKFLRRLRSLGAHRWDRRTGVLEICSGRGSGLVAWRALGFRDVYGVDLSVALVMASDRHGSSVVGDARRLPFRTASRDVAIVQGGLHHLPEFDDVRAALAEGGFSETDIKEIILQQTIYCGVPAANHAFKEAAEVIAELKKPK